MQRIAKIGLEGVVCVCVCVCVCGRNGLIRRAFSTSVRATTANKYIL